MKTVQSDGEFSAEAVKLGSDAPAEAVGRVQFHSVPGEGSIDYDHLVSYLEENSSLRYMIEPAGRDTVVVWLMARADEPVTAEQVATNELAAYIGQQLGDDIEAGAMGVEVDAPNRELWVHEVGDELADAIVQEANVYARSASAEAGVPLQFDLSIQPYHEESPSHGEGKCVHIGDVRFEE